MSSDAALVLVSNRGPATFQDGEPRRGGGGLVTALTGLVHHRDAVWIASALTAGDAEQSRAHDGRSFEIELEGARYRVRLVESDEDAYDRFYNVIANPMLWFIQHYLWDLSNAPDIRRHEIEAYEQGYCRVNGDLAEAVLEEVEDEEEAVVMLHDYHLYVAPKLIRAKRPDLFLHHFVHIPWTQPDAWRVLPADIREDLYEGILSNDIIAFHTRSYRRNFLLCCRELFDLDVDEEAGVVRFGGRDVWVRSYPLPISAENFHRNAQRPAVHQYEREILRRRREHLILRVDRADLSKNVLRGFTAFDLFLEQHPEFKEQVTFIAHLIPSRQDVAEYQEYLERIEALVAVVNHRHGTTDWMPIELRLRENLEEAIAAYKHYDLLMVNAMFDGMNLIAKEGPLVNERNGVSLLSENTGAHEELADFALSVNPFDVHEQADAIFRALSMSAEERSWRAEADRDGARPRRLGGRPAGGHRLEAPRRGARPVLASRVRTSDTCVTSTAHIAANVTQVGEASTGRCAVTTEPDRAWEASAGRCAVTTGPDRA
jgi:trehalose 6-phosphate synthase